MLFSGQGLIGCLCGFQIDLLVGGDKIYLFVILLYHLDSLYFHLLFIAIQIQSTPNDDFLNSSTQEDCILGSNHADYSIYGCQDQNNTIVDIDQNYQNLEPVNLQHSIIKTPPPISENETPENLSPAAVPIPPSQSFPSQFETPKTYQPKSAIRVSSVRVSRRTARFYQSDEVSAMRSRLIECAETAPAWQVKKALRAFESGDEAGSIA